MMQIGDYIEAPELAKLAGVRNARGMQCGILINKKTNLTIIKPKLPDKKRPLDYPNRWDSDKIGILHFCGTNKGQSSKQIIQNLESPLNKHVNEAIFPIHVFLCYPDSRYRYMGEFIRTPQHDKWVELDGKKVISFGLISKDIEKTKQIIIKMMNPY